MCTRKDGTSIPSMELNAYGKVDEFSAWMIDLGF